MFHNFPFAESPWSDADLAKREDLSPEQKSLVNTYRRDGFVNLGRVLDDNAIAAIKSQVTPLFDPNQPEGPISYYRRQDAWEHAGAARDAALNPQVLSALQLLYGRKPIPFQTLHFLYGSQQANHSDAILFNTLPQRFMCGVWIALDPVTADNGPLFYYPGSHRLPQLYPEDINLEGLHPDDFFNKRYPAIISEVMRSYGLERVELRAQPGEAFVWASNLVHGGMPRLDKQPTRWSQVTHYFFDECIWYVPLYSRPLEGLFHLVDVRDFHKGGILPQRYNGKEFTAERVGQGLHRLVFGDSPLAQTPFQLTQPIANIDTWQDTDNELIVVGWAAAPEDLIKNDARDVQLVLSTLWKRRAYPCTPMLRPDVRRSLDLVANAVGFRAVIPKKELPQGKLDASIELHIGGQSPHRIALNRSIEIHI